MNPLVVGIMPTRGRVSMAQQALECFLAQDYPHKSLVILDDADEPSFPDGFSDEIRYRCIRYSRLNIRYQIPIKLNMCCEIAKEAEIIARFDSDDWSYRWRLSDQVRRLEETGKAVTGYHSLPFFDEASGEVYEYRSGPHYALGTSLTFRRDWWQANRFDEKKWTGSDTAFVREARQKDQLDAVDHAGAMVARVHKGNTAPKRFTSAEYKQLPFESLPEGFRALLQAV